MALLSAANDVQSILGYQFTDPRILLEALAAAGSGFNLHHSPNATDGNKRLAQMGDAILKMIVLDAWYISGAERAVGSQQISRIGSKSNLSDCGQRIGLGNYISTNPSSGNLPPTPAVVATTVGALIAAVWFDSQKNLETVRLVLNNISLLASADPQ